MDDTSIDILTYAIQNPNLQQDVNRPRYQGLVDTIAYTQYLGDSIRSLNDPVDENVGGLLYVPNLSKAQAASCPQASNATLIPKNATRMADLPIGYPVMALIPWLSANCTLAFMEAANLTVNDPDQLFAAMITYLPDAKLNGNGTALPPPLNSSVWGLGKNSSWINGFAYSLYAVPPNYGAEWMRQISLYNGNATGVPNGHNLTDQGVVAPSDYVRLSAAIHIANIDDGSSNVPSLWVFLLIILALLIIIIGTISTCMRCLARQRRSILRRRIAEGNVDLEALGIKRLTIPREVLEKMPLYTYTAKPAAATTSVKSPIASFRPIEQQTTCAICLDDFVVAQPHTSSPMTSSSEVAFPSQVRELPCGHIFHADCVDPFLTAHSSLCPLCKKSSLPIGYVPKNITNVMVRRERQTRRLRGSETSRTGRSRDALWQAIGRRGRAADDGSRVSLAERFVERLDTWREARNRRDADFFRSRGSSMPLSSFGRSRTHHETGRETNGQPIVVRQNEAMELPMSPLSSAAEQVVPAGEHFPASQSPVQAGSETTVRAGPAAIPATSPMAEAEHDHAAAPSKSWWRNAAEKLFPRA